MKYRARFIAHATSALLFSLLLCVQPLSAATFLYLNSETSDYIGQGIEQTITDAGTTFTATRNFDNGVKVWLQGGASWTTDFAAPGDVELVPGTYIGAIRFPFQSPTQPGLSISGEGRGCNSLTGHFTVHEVQYGPSDTVTQFAANFEQHCEGGTPALTGAIRFNSDLPIVIITPTAAAGSDRQANEGDLISLDGSYSNGGSTAITAYEWTQTNGATATLSDTSSATPSFTAPSVDLGGESLVFQLTITNTNGETSSDSVSITVASKSDPVTYIFFDSEAGDYIGAGITQTLDENDGVFSITENNEYANISFNGEDSWSLDFAALSGSTLTVGAYENATRWPFQDAAEPGLNVSGAGRGCNTLTGRFDVIQIGHDATGAIDSFAANFEQHCSGNVAALFGEVRINYLNPSIPSCNAGADQSATEGENVILDASASADSDGSIVSYDWQQISGTSVTLSSTSTAMPSFTAPAPSTGSSEDLIFKITITDDQSFKAEDTITVTAHSSGASGGSQAGSGGGGSNSLLWLCLLILLLILRSIPSRPRVA